jgi:hypothetical protein
MILLPTLSDNINNEITTGETMKQFSQFLTESDNEESTHHLHHHTKGKYVLHKKGKHHHLKNQYGDVTHSFYNMDTHHILGILKYNHDIGKKHHEEGK